MPISLPDIVRITNAEQSGIVLATEVSGSRCVATLEELYTIADPILSPSRNNTNNDALGQEWYVVSENASYKLIDWNNRKSSAGWESLLSTVTWSTVVATGKNEEVGIIPAGGTRQLTSSEGNNIANFNEDNVQLSYVNGSDVNLLDISNQGVTLQSTDGSKTYSFRVYDDGITIRGRYIDFYNQAGKLTFPVQNFTSNIGDLGEVTVFQFGTTSKKTAVTMVSDRYMGFSVPRSSTGEERYIVLHTGESSSGDLKELYIGDKYIRFSGAPVQGEDAVEDNHFVTKRQLSSGSGIVTWAGVTSINTPSIGRLGDNGYLQVMNGRDTIFQVNKSVSYVENRIDDSSIATLLSGKIIRNNGSSGSVISSGAALRWWNGTDISSNIIISASSSGPYVDGAPLQIMSGTQSNHAASYGQLTDHANDLCHVKVEDGSSAEATFTSGTRFSDFNQLNGVLITPSEMEGYPADAYKCVVTKVGVLSRVNGGSFTSDTLWAHLWRWMGGTNFEYVTASTSSNSWTALNQVAEWEFDNVEIATGKGFLITWSTSQDKPASYSSPAWAVNLAVGNTDSEGLTVVYGGQFKSDLQAITTVTATYYTVGSLSAYGVPIASGSQIIDYATTEVAGKVYLAKSFDDDREGAVIPASLVNGTSRVAIKTKKEYDAIEVKDDNTLYIIKDDFLDTSDRYITTNPELVVVNGEANWEVSHNLGIQDVIVQIVEVATNKVVYADVTLNSVNLVTISLVSDENIASGTYKVIIR